MLANADTLYYTDAGVNLWSVCLSDAFSAMVKLNPVLLRVQRVYRLHLCTSNLVRWHTEDVKRLKLAENISGNKYAELSY